MAVWDISSAISSLRSILGDGAADKFEFKAPTYPETDGVTTRFFVGQTRLVTGSVRIYQDGAALTESPSGFVSEVEEAKGEFSVVPAPVGELLASYYYQWFTDADLTVFLNDAAQLLMSVDITGEIATGLRPVLLLFAAHNAYLRKAAEFAETVDASAGGYTFGRNKAAPNWREMAAAALAAAKEKLTFYTNNPLTKMTPTMAFASYKLQSYVPE